jgi:hypothetical protein
MGLLDDAIRDHLDLKRRHGADPSEIERAEREALGPVRRAPDELEQEGLGDQVGGEYTEQFASEHTQQLAPPEDWVEDEYVADEEWAEEIPQEPAPPPEPVYEAPPPHPAPGAVEEPEPPPQPDLEEPLPPDAEHTVEYQLPDEEKAPEEHSAQPPQRAEGDVLEETPEFLQDAPEHDRLWFEQRPPRDFDFED